MTSRDYRDYILDILVPVGAITCRAMFGGYSLYKNGVIFALIAEEMLYFKVDEGNRADFEAKGSEPFTYEAKGKRVSLSYWAVPLEVMEEETELVRWFQKACEAGLRSARRKRVRLK